MTNLQQQMIERRNTAQLFTGALLLLVGVLAVVFFLGRRRMHRLHLVVTDAEDAVVVAARVRGMCDAGSEERVAAWAADANPAELPLAAVVTSPKHRSRSPCTGRGSCVLSRSSSTRG